MKVLKSHVIWAAKRKKISHTTFIFTTFNHSNSLYFFFFFFFFFILPSTKALKQNNATKSKMVSSSTQTDIETFIEPVIFTNLAVALMAASVTLICIIIVVISFFCVYRNCFKDKLLTEENFVKGLYQEGRESAYVPIFVERKMAQSAQMFFYQFQKQQLIAQEREKKRNSMDSCSDTENNDKDGAVMSCPGLALHNGETIEVRNPLFVDDVSASPGWNTTTPPSHLSTNNNSADENRENRSSPLPFSRPPSSTRPNTPFDDTADNTSHPDRPSDDTADNTSHPDEHPILNLNGNNIEDSNHSDLIPDDNNNKIPMKVVMTENKSYVN